MRKLIKRIFKANTPRKSTYEQLLYPRKRAGLKPIYKIEMAVVFCFLSFAGFSQVHFDMGAGASTFKDTKNTCVVPVMRLAFGYQFSNNITTEGIIQPAITRKSTPHNFLGFKVGYNIYDLIPSIGYLYDFRSSDNHSLNKWGVAYSLKYVVPVNENGGLFFDGLYCQKSIQVTVGFHVIFNNY